MLVDLSHQVGGYLYSVFVQSWDGWIALGFIGQGLFTMRFLVQWIATRASVHADDAIADAAWASSQRMSRVCYGVAPAPGTPIPGADDFQLPDNDDAIASGRDNFTAIVCTILNLEYLYLRHEGHQRARFTRDGAGWQGVWLTP